jgi:hypothetical protein
MSLWWLLVFVPALTAATIAACWGLALIIVRFR